MAMVPTASVLADGTEELGPMSIATETGSRIIAAGVGLELSQVNQTIDFIVPSTASIRQVLAYWEGASAIDSPPLEDTIVIGGQSITGMFIGGTNTPTGAQFLTEEPSQDPFGIKNRRTVW